VVAILVAVALDLAVGDPGNRFHPVAWLGRLINAGRRRLCVGGARRLFVSGAGLTLLAAAVAALAAEVVARLAAHAGWAQPLVLGVALWLLLSLRGLFAAALEVARLLAAGDMSAARHARPGHLLIRL
jgi:adenosylcobinamide-phosphate synthase